METKGYMKKGEALFVSVRYPMLSIQVGGHGFMSNGRPERPVFVHFHPGPFGGEFRSSDSKLVELLRNRDGMDDHYQEVESEEELSAISDIRDKIVGDKVEKVVRGSALKKAVKKADVGEIEPESRKPEAPKAAAGPGGKKGF